MKVQKVFLDYSEDEFSVSCSVWVPLSRYEMGLYTTNGHMLDIITRSKMNRLNTQKPTQPVKRAKQHRP